MNVTLIYCTEGKGKDEGKLVTYCLGSPLIERKSFILVYRQCTGTHYQPISCPFSHTSFLICDTCPHFWNMYSIFLFVFRFAEFSNRFIHNSSQGCFFPNVVATEMRWPPLKGISVITLNIHSIDWTSLPWNTRPQQALNRMLDLKKC